MSNSDDLHLPINHNSIIVEEQDEKSTAIKQCAKLTPLQHLLDKVNGQGSYQFKSFMIFNLMWFVTGWLLLGEVFFYDDSFQCRSFVDEEQCQRLVCSMQQSQRVQEIIWHANSIVFAFEPTYLICQLSGIATVLTSMIFIGSLLGFFTIPYFADNWGRRVAIRSAWMICTMGVGLAAFATSASMVGMGYFLAGFGANPAITLCYSFINEQCLGRSRQRYGVIIQVFYAIGESTIGLMFMQGLGLSWRQVLLICLGLTVTVNFLLLYVVQTPKFLIKKSERKTLAALNEIALKNNRPSLNLQQVHQLNIQQQKGIDDSSSQQEQSDNNNLSTFSNDQISQQIQLQVQNRLKHREEVQSSSLILLFKYKSLLWKSIGAAAGFLGIQVIYYSTSFNLDQAGYGKLINQQIIGVSQIFGYIAGEFLISKIPRRKAAIFGMTISASICILLAVLNIFKQQNQDMVKILGVIGLIINRFVLCCFWSIFYVYIAELFPTKVRSLAFGWASAVGTTGSTLSPYIIFFSKSLHVDSWILPGVIGLMSAIVLTKLPETFGKPSQDWIQEEEMERLQKEKQKQKEKGHHHHRVK